MISFTHKVSRRKWISATSTLSPPFLHFTPWIKKVLKFKFGYVITQSISWDLGILLFVHVDSGNLFNFTSMLRNLNFHFDSLNKDTNEHNVGKVGVCFLSTERVLYLPVKLTVGGDFISSSHHPFSSLFFSHLRNGSRDFANRSLYPEAPGSRP